MRVLAVSYLFPNAAFPAYGVFVLNRLKAVAKHADIKVINPIPWSPLHPLLGRYRRYGQIPDYEVIDGLEVYHPRFLSIPRLLKGVECHSYSAAVCRTASMIADDFPFDLVDLHWTFPDLPAGVRLARKRSVPVLATIRGVEAFHFQDRDVRQDVVRRCLPEVNGIIALSRQLLDTAGQLAAGVPGRVIRNGVDTDRFHPLPRQEARRRLGIAGDELVILGVGSLVRVKGFDLLIQALPELLHTFGPRLRIYVAGGGGHAGDDGRALRSLVASLGLEANVVFTGPVANEELPWWYNAADVFCLPSRSEGSPNVLTEALACGCPVVAADVGAVREIMAGEGEMGICVPPGEVGALGEALRKVLASPPPRQEIAARMRTYGWDWCAAQVLDAYRVALDGGRSGGRGHG